MVRAARPQRLEGDPRAAQLERARHHAQPLLGRLVPQGVQAAEGPQGRAQANVLEGPLRGLELPHQGLAERQDDRRLHGLLPVRGGSRRSAQGAQHAGREGVVGAQQPRPHALAPGRLQRLRQRRLVELRRPAARGLRAQDRHDRHRGRARPSAPAQGGRPRQGRGPRLPAQHDRQGARGRPGDRRGRAPHPPAGQAHPGELPAAAHPDVHDQAARGCGSPATPSCTRCRRRSRRTGASAASTGCASACASSRPRAAG